MSGQLFLWNTTTGLKCPNIPWTHTLLIGLFVGSGVGLIVGGFDGVFVGGFDGLFVGVFVVGLFVGEREGKLSIRFSVGEIDGIFSWVILWGYSWVIWLVYLMGILWAYSLE